MSENYSYVDKLHAVGEDKPADAIYEQLKNLIIHREIEVGSRLPSERKMMEIFGRSRSTIREALRMLERDGYISKVSRSSGAVVQEPGVEGIVDSLESMIQMQNLDIKQVLEFRQITETKAASQAAERRSEEDLKVIEDILLESKVSKGDPNRFAEYDLKFHMAVANASQNKLYGTMLLVCRHILANKLTQVLQSGGREDVTDRYDYIIETHQHIYDAIKKQDAEEAYEYMKTHIDSAEEELLG
ncbi:MAG: FadR family transcriptional regulator [Eubacterium sp.]|nr:FadR family transcriptional regulator [Eubacterium sp.]